MNHQHPDEGATPFQAGKGYARRFPIEELPDNMRGYAADLAERKCVPVDLVALSMLGIQSGITGPRIVIRRDQDWIEPTNLYALAGMASGSAKSPAVSELQRGLWKARKNVGEMHGRKMSAQQEELNAEIERCLMRAKDITCPLEEKDGVKARAKTLQAEARELAEKPPHPPSLSFDGDTSPEALAARMSANGGTASVIDDEGTLLRNLGGQYSGKTANLAPLLKGYDCLPYHPSRITRDTVAMLRACLSITISPQPALIAEMLRNTMMDETGLINRFIVSMPGDLVGKREGRPSTFIDDVPDKPNTHWRDWWADHLASLAEYDLLTGERDEEPPVIDLTRGAWKLHYDFQERFEQRMDGSRGGDLAKIRGWASKHCGRILRVAAHHHLGAGWTPDDRCEEETMRSAIKIGDWALEHFLHAGKVVGLSESAGRIKEYIDGRELKFASRSEISQQVFKNNVPAGQLTVWIEELIATGRYEWASLPTSGRSKTVVRRVAASS